MRKPKVMHVIRALPVGGVEIMFLTTLHSLQEQGKTENLGVVASSSTLTMDTSGPARVTKLGLPYTKSRMMLALLAPLEFIALFSVILKEDPNIIYGYFGSKTRFFISIAGKLLGKKVVLRETELRNIRQASGRLIDPISHRLCDRIVTLSGDSGNELRALGIPGEKMVYIPNGKNPASFARIDRSEARRRLGIMEDWLVLGIVSRVNPTKGHDTVIAVLPELLRLRKDVRFVVAGECPDSLYMDRIRASIDEHGLGDRVIFLGRRMDVADVLPAFDIFVHPSAGEGCPGAVLEAMCAGLPVVAGNQGGAKELLEGCGMLVPPGDTGALAAALTSLISDPALRSAYGRRARNRAMRRFSLQRMLGAYERLFISMANENPEDVQKSSKERCAFIKPL